MLGFKPLKYQASQFKDILAKVSSVDSLQQTRRLWYDLYKQLKLLRG